MLSENKGAHQNIIDNPDFDIKYTIKIALVSTLQSSQYNTIVSHQRVIYLALFCFTVDLY